MFPSGSFWRAGRARFAPPVDETLLPASLLERFGHSDAAERVVAALRYLVPVTAGAGLVMDSYYPQKMQGPLRFPHEL